MKILNILPLFLALSTYAQIAISSNPNFVMHPNAAVHIDQGNNVVQLPHVSLKGISDKVTVLNPSVGLMVYNTNDNVSPHRGFCYWDGDKWINYEDSQASVVKSITIPEVSLDMLGYNPVGQANLSATNFTIQGNTSTRNTTLTKVGCVKWKKSLNGFKKGVLNGTEIKFLDGNDHTYCGYTSTLELDWNEAFKAAKSQGGYLVTITSSAEWEFLKKVFYENKYYYENSSQGATQPDIKYQDLSSLNYRNKIDDKRRVWIGYNKVKPIGYHQQFTWITGEISEVNWISGKRFDAFATNEPNDDGGVEGCTHIHRMIDGTVGSDVSKLKWNDTPCDIGSNATHKAVAPKFVIIEFNQ